jgi:pimeloyl-ACP methyl ester carboxylesterase
MRRILHIAVGLVAGWLGSAWFVCWALTRRYGPRTEPLPETDLPLEQHRLKTEDGLELGSWFYRGNPEAPVVLLVHGVNDTRTDQFPVMEALAARGYGVLTPSLRGHGDSQGYAGDYLGTRYDVLAGLNFLEIQCPDRQYLIFGRSLGAGAALFASKCLSTRVNGYFLESPFQNLEIAIKNRIGLFLPQPLSGLAYLGLRMWSGRFLYNTISEISPVEAAGNLPPQVPVQIVAGASDRRSRIEESMAVKSQIGPSASLTVIEHGGDGASPRIVLGVF